MRALVQALERHIDFALKQDIQTSVKSFPSLLIDLVYGRTSEFAEAFSHYPDICGIASIAFQSEFRRICVNRDEVVQGGLKMTILVNNTQNEIDVSIQLLTAIAVVLSVWRGEVASDSTAAQSIESLCDGLFAPDDLDHENPYGLVSAKLPGSKAVPVEPVSLKQNSIYLFLLNNMAVDSRGKSTAPLDCETSCFCSTPRILGQATTMLGITQGFVLNHDESS